MTRLLSKRKRLQTENWYDKAGEKMSISENYQRIMENIQKSAEKAGRNMEEITLLGVSKTVDLERMQEAIACGVYDLGENKVQELLWKYDALPKENLRWHLIGHLQTNKVKYIADKVELIHSIDSIKVARELNKQAEKCGRNIKFLLQVNVSGEESKFGISPDEVEEFLENAAVMRNIRLCGLMTIPPFTENPEHSRKYFYKLKKLFVDIGAKNYDNIFMETLSMGMSGDYGVAIEEGATIVRVGTALFGARDYT